MLSEPIRTLLANWGLVTPRQMQRARRRVDTLARELPPLDSLWLDVFRQMGLLTPYQVRQLEDDPDGLVVGPFLKRDVVTRGPEEVGFLAVDRSGAETYLKRITVPKTSAEETLLAIDAVCELRNRLRSPVNLLPDSVVAPEEERRSGVRFRSEEFFLTTPHAEGEDLAQRLVRRGRMPSPVVESIARHLLYALADLHAAGVMHGDVRLSHVRLTTSGEVRLVEPLLRSILDPPAWADPELRTERAWGVAPERLQIGEQVGPASDLFSLGWLLWHLLAGRPPLSSADPQVILSEIRTERLPSIGDVAPQADPKLIALVDRLTAPDPRERGTAAELLPAWKPHRTDVRTLRDSLSAPPTPLFEKPRANHSSLRRGVASAVVTGAILFGAFASDRFGWAETLGERLAAGDASQAVAAAEPEVGSEPETKTASLPETPAAPSAEPLPAPDAAGRVLLSGGATYAADVLASRAELVIESTGEPATILVTDRPLTLTSDRITLRNVEFRFAPQATSAASSLVVTSSHLLSVRECRFLPPADGLPKIGLAWRPLDAVDRSGTELDFARVEWSGNLTGIYVDEPPDRWRLAECLKVGDGPLLRLAKSPRTGRDSSVLLDSVTLRDAGPLLRTSPASGRVGFTSLEAVGCVFHLRSEATPLLELIAERVPPEVLATLSITGQDSLTSAPLRIACWRPSAQYSRLPLPDDAVSVEGLIAAPFEFTAPVPSGTASAWDASVLKLFTAPLLSGERPGIREGERG